MPIVASDIKYRLSGGASNTLPTASLGGAKSSTEAGANIFDTVSGAEGAAGDVEYRCVYVHNNHGSLALQGAQVWIQANTPSADSEIEIGLGTSGINGTEQTVADEQTAPTGVTFDLAEDAANALSIGDIPAGQHKAVWIKRTITAAAAAASDGFTLRSRGDTNP